MLTAERFSQLAEIYGADLARWPAAERMAAAAYVEARPEAAASALGPERALEAHLDAFEVHAPSRLRARVLADAPLARAAARAWRLVTAAGLGLGLAASCAAGVAVGLTLAPNSVARLIGGSPAAGPDGESALADPAGDAASG